MRGKDQQPSGQHYFCLTFVPMRLEGFVADVTLLGLLHRLLAGLEVTAWSAAGLGGGGRPLADGHVLLEGRHTLAHRPTVRAQQAHQLRTWTIRR